MNVVEMCNSLREKQSHSSERVRWYPCNAYLHIGWMFNILVDTNRKLNQIVLLGLTLGIFSIADAGTKRDKVNYCLLAVFLRERTDIFGNEQILLETKRYSWIDLGTTRTEGWTLKAIISQHTNKRLILSSDTRMFNFPSRILDIFSLSRKKNGTKKVP